MLLLVRLKKKRENVCLHVGSWADFCLSTFALFFLSFFFFLLFRAAPVAYEVPKLGVELEIQVPAYSRATATQDLSRVCDLHHSSWQCWILPMSEARDWTRILMDPSWVCYHWAMRGTPESCFLQLLFHKHAPVIKNSSKTSFAMAIRNSTYGCTNIFSTIPLISQLFLDT